jgi:hypothetical protein
LDGAYLGLTTGNTILLDTNAAGYGWFIDPTTLDDSEFSIPHSASPSPHSIDLLSAVMHEMGHVLGFDHESDFEAMIETLAVGVRRHGSFSRARLAD